MQELESADVFIIQEVERILDLVLGFKMKKIDHQIMNSLFGDYVLKSS